MEYLDRLTPPNPALYLQCYNLFVVEPILKKKRREDGEKTRNKRSDKKEPGNSRKKGEREK